MNRIEELEHQIGDMEIEIEDAQLCLDLMSKLMNGELSIPDALTTIANLLKESNREVGVVLDVISNKLWTIDPGMGKELDWACRNEGLATISNISTDGSYKIEFH